jgi:ferric-dicitrate binding protein FerR (iron transport regulator)
VEEKVINWVKQEMEGNLTAESARDLLVWRNDDPQHEITYLEIVQLFQLLPGTDSNPAPPDVDAAWSNFSSKIDEHSSIQKPTILKNRLRSLPVMLRIAAAVVLAFGIWFVYDMIRHDSATYIARTANHTLELVDGTVVTLKRGSSIEFFTDPDIRNERKVTLSGTGLFQVKSDPAHPFIIQAGGLDVEVLGTTFQVAAVSPDAMHEVVVLEGRVRVTDRNSGEAWTLIENERLRWHPTSNQGDKKFDETGNAYAWQSGILQFQGMALSDVLEVLYRNYSVKVMLTKPEMQMCRYSSRFTNAEIDEVLQAIAESFGMVLKTSPTGVYYLTGGKCQ